MATHLNALAAQYDISRVTLSMPLTSSVLNWVEMFYKSSKVQFKKNQAKTLASVTQEVKIKTAVQKQNKNRNHVVNPHFNPLTSESYEMHVQEFSESRWNLSASACVTLPLWEE